MTRCLLFRRSSLSFIPAAGVQTGAVGPANQTPPAPATLRLRSGRSLRSSPMEPLSRAPAAQQGPTSPRAGVSGNSGTLGGPGACRVTLQRAAREPLDPPTCLGLPGTRAVGAHRPTAAPRWGPQPSHPQEPGSASTWSVAHTQPSSGQLSCRRLPLQLGADPAASGRWCGLVGGVSGATCVPTPCSVYSLLALYLQAGGLWPDGRRTPCTPRKVMGVEALEGLGPGLE